MKRWFDKRMHGFQTRCTVGGTFIFCMLILFAGCNGSSSLKIELKGVSAASCSSGGKILSGTMTVEVVATEGTLSQVELSIDSLPALVDTLSPFKVDFDTTTLQDGSAHLIAKGVDEEGNTDLVTLEICIDNNPPEVSILAPTGAVEIALEDTKLELVVRASDTVMGGVKLIKAKLEVAGTTLETVEQSEQTGESNVARCRPETGPDATCTLYPNQLSIRLDPGQTESGTITVTAWDAAGLETSSTLPFTLKTRVKWIFNAAGKVLDDAAVLANGNIVFSTREANMLHVLSPAGSEICRWTPPNWITTRPVASADGTKVYVGVFDGIYIINPTNCSATAGAKGTFGWSDPVLREDKGALFIGKQKRTATGGQIIPPSLCAYSTKDASEIGCFAVSTVGDQFLYGTVALSSDGTKAYIGSLDHSLYAVDVSAPASMKSLWTAQTGNEISTTPLVTDDAVYITSSDKFIQAYDPGTGTKIPGFLFKGGAAFHSSVIQSTDGSTLYAGCDDQMFYAIAAKTGAILAKHKLGIPAVLNEDKVPLIGPEGQVIASCAIPASDKEQCGLHALDPKTLDLQWEVYTEIGEAESQVCAFMASPVLDQQTVYIGNLFGKFYAVDAAPLPQ